MQKNYFEYGSSNQINTNETHPVFKKAVITKQVAL